MSEESIRYSVIIPVYKAEKTLRRCVDSLLPQLSGSDEILLVDDGSPDGSGSICDEYGAADPRVRVIHKANGGVSSARNAGLDAARGKWVLFVDSDDYVPRDLVSSLSELQKEEAWDWIILSNCVDDGTALHKSIQTPFRALTREETLPALIDGICRKLLNSPWAKLYCREILEEQGIRFPPGVSIAEDRAFNIRYSMYVARYLVSDRIGYCVNTENEQSLSRKPRGDLPEQFRISGEYIQTAIREAGIPEPEKEQYRRACSFGICRGIYKDAKDLIRDGIGWFSRQRILWRRCGEINSKRMRYPKTRYCRLITLPVRLRQTWAIDLAAQKLLGR